MPIPATQTLRAIDAAIDSDNGDAWRAALSRWIPLTDAFGKDRGFSRRLGGSSLGHHCTRYLWYQFRWYFVAEFEARLRRLFNRGHLEEARFSAMLEIIGCAVHAVDGNGKQFEATSCNGNVVSKIDGVVVGLPDLPSGTPALVEMKTHNDKSYKELERKGVRESKPQHYSQCVLGMAQFNLHWALYMAVNKNNDALYLELIPADPATADGLLQRADYIIHAVEAPDRISNTPAWMECKWCSARKVCWNREEPLHNCRSCAASKVNDDGWFCSHHKVVLSHEQQFVGCQRWESL